MRSWVMVMTLVTGACGAQPDAAEPAPQRAARPPVPSDAATQRPEDQASSSQPVQRPSRAARVEALVTRLASPLLEGEGAPSALAIGVIAAGEQQFVGLGRLSPGGPAPTKDTLFHVASLTKPHTALLVALLAGDGKLELDDPVARCRRGKPQALCGSKPTTLRHLLTHSSGLRVVPRDRGGDYPPARLREYLETTRPRDRVPGRSFRYSATGFGVIALRIEEVVGKPYEALLRRRVLGPVGSKAIVELGADDQARLAPGHDSSGEVAEAGPTREAFVASGGLIASARDLLALLEVFVSPESKPALQKAVLMTRTRDDGLVGFHGSAVAFGWMVDRLSGSYWHPGVSSVHRSVIAYHPELRVGVVVLANRFLPVKDIRLERLAVALLARLPVVIAEK